MALTAFAANSNAIQNIANTEVLVSPAIAVLNVSGSTYRLSLIGSLPAGAYSSFSVRVGPNASAADNVICVLQNNIVTFAQAQTDVNNWCNSFSGQPGTVYNFPANSALNGQKMTVLQGTLHVTLGSVNGTSNTGLVSVFNTGAVNPANPLQQASGLLGSNTVNLGGAFLSITGMIANSFSVTYNIANTVVANTTNANNQGLTLASGFLVQNTALANGTVTLGLAEACT